jgi:hypothetical protein
MDTLNEHERLTDEFLDSLIRCCGTEAPAVLRKLADALVQRLREALFCESH